MACFGPKMARSEINWTEANLEQVQFDGCWGPQCTEAALVLPFSFALMNDTKGRKIVELRSEDRRMKRARLIRDGMLHMKPPTNLISSRKQ